MNEIENRIASEFESMKTNNTEILQGIHQKINSQSRKGSNHKIVRKSFVIAALITVLAVTTAFAAYAYLPGFIRRVYMGNLTITHYERGYLPHDVPKHAFGMQTIEGIPIHEDVNTIKTFSMGDAIEAFGTNLLIPTYSPYGHVPVFINIHTSESGTTIEIWFSDAWFCEESGMIRHNPTSNLSFYLLYQTYIGDAHVQYDLIGAVTEIMVNDHPAIWSGTRNGMLTWIQDGILVNLAPADMDMDVVLRIAESLQPMR